MLGPFKGRVTVLGGAVGTRLMLDRTPISANFGVYWEFETENRTEGVAAFFTFALPLSVNHPPQKVVARP